MLKMLKLLVNKLLIMLLILLLQWLRLSLDIEENVLKIQIYQVVKLLLNLLLEIKQKWIWNCVLKMLNSYTVLNVLTLLNSKNLLYIVNLVMKQHFSIQ